MRFVRYRRGVAGLAVKPLVGLQTRAPEARRAVGEEAPLGQTSNVSNRKPMVSQRGSKWPVPGGTKMEPRDEWMD